MLSEKMQEALNNQLNWELYSGYVYLSMSAYFESLNLKGFANWMRVQEGEEKMHAMKFFNFITERRGRVLLQAIGAPNVEWDSPLAALEEAFHHEQGVTQRIHQLVDLALAESDHATNAFLQWFVTEQVEEESSVDEVAQKLKLMQDAPGGLFMLDRELAQRQPSPLAVAAVTGGALAAEAGGAA